MKTYKLIGIMLLVLLSLADSTLAQNDRDGDGLADTRDKCPDVAGSPDNGGCPPNGFAPNPPADTDRDTIPDTADVCPNQFGLAQFSGCPDSDGDQIPDNQDNCPQQAGVTANFGCPPSEPMPQPVDSDGDTVLDSLDVCPNEVGLPEWAGCPDIDGDGLTTQYDNCPTVAGPRETGGCPAQPPANPVVEVQPTVTATQRPRPTLPTSGCYVITEGRISVNIRPSRSTDTTPVGNLDPYEVYPAQGRIGDWVLIAEGQWVAASVVQISPDCQEISEASSDELTDVPTQGGDLVCGYFYAQFQNISGNDHQSLQIRFPDAALGPAQNGTWNHWGPVPLAAGETRVVEKTLYLQPTTDFDYLLAGPNGTSFAVIGNVSFLPVNPNNCTPPLTSFCYYATLTVENTTPFYVPIQYVIQPYLFPFPAAPEVTAAPPSTTSAIVIYQESTWYYDPSEFSESLMMLVLSYNQALLNLTASEVALDNSGGLCGGDQGSEVSSLVLTPAPSADSPPQERYDPVSDFADASREALNGNMVCGHFQGTYQNNSAEERVLLVRFLDAFSGLPKNGSWNHWGPTVVEPGEAITVDKKLFLAADTNFDIMLIGPDGVVFTPIGGVSFEATEDNQCQLPQAVCYYATLNVQNLTGEFLEIYYHIRPYQFPVNPDDPWSNGFGNSLVVAPPAQSSTINIFYESYWIYDDYEHQGHLPEVNLYYDQALLNITTAEVGILAETAPNRGSLVTQTQQVPSNGNCAPPPPIFTGLDNNAPTGVANDPEAYICLYFEQEFWNSSGLSQPTPSYQFVLRDSITQEIIASLTEPFDGIVFSGTERFQHLSYIPAPINGLSGTNTIVDLVMVTDSPEVTSIGPMFRAIVDNSYCESSIPPFTLNEAYGFNFDSCLFAYILTVTYNNLTDSSVELEAYLTDAAITDIGILGSAITEPFVQTWVPGEVATKHFTFFHPMTAEGFIHYALNPSVDVPSEEFEVEFFAGPACPDETGAN